MESPVSMKTFNRRQILRAGGAASLLAMLPHRRAVAQTDDARFLIVLTAYGGASIVDAQLAVSRSECAAAGGDPARLLTFGDHPGTTPSGERYQLVRAVPGSPFRACAWRGTVNFGQPILRSIDQYEFVRRHKEDMLVMTQTVTSVNHDTAQARSVSGNGAWRGRTLQEEVAASFGANMPLPNVHLATGSGFVRRRTDPSLDPRFSGEVVPDPTLWPLALSGHAAIASRLLGADVDRARRIRDEVIEPATTFGRVFGASARRQAWLRTRAGRQADIEAANLTSRLLLREDGPDLPLADYGLSSAPERSRLAEVFPSLAEDPVEAQAALAFLLLKHRVSCAVTLGPNATGITVGGPNDDDFLRQLSLGFDASHTDHWSAQMWMWDRVMSLADRLIGLLKEEPFGDGGSLWDRTVLLVATEFGRNRTRPPDAIEFSSGHDLNNGVLLISPRLRGNRVVGGVDPATVTTFGAEPEDWSRPTPGRHLSEAHPYALTLAALGVDTSGSGLPDMQRLVRG